MSPSPGLRPLLAALRHARVPIGITEELRLQRVFALDPDLGHPRDSPERLRSILSAVLIRRMEDRKAFDRVFDAWLRETEATWRAPPTPRGGVTPAPKPDRDRPGKRKKTPSKRRILLAAGALGLAAGLTFLAVHYRPKPTEQTRKPEAPAEHPAVQEPQPTLDILAPDALRNRTFTSLAPRIAVEQAPWSGWPPLLLALLGLGAALAIHLGPGRRPWFPPPAPAPIRKGPPRVLLRPPELDAPELLSRRDQEALVWGIDKLEAEALTPRLDLPATVAATARAGGLPEPRFRPLVMHREVWLWVDEAAADPALGRLADEVQDTLQAHGLHAERATFWGMPERLTAADGRVFAPREVDERRDQAIAAVLTDGRLLCRRWADARQRVRLAALLRLLSRWPRLVFVDFSADPDLTALLARQEVERVRPERLPNFLGGVQGAAPGRRSATGRPNVSAWAACCALCPAPVDQAAALLLRRRLGLAVPPWALGALRAEAPGPPGLLCWPSGRRVQRLNWLLESEDQGSGRLAAGSLLDRALDFWEQRYDKDMEARREQAGDLPWEGTPAERRLSAELALLRLWRDPKKAIETLYALFQGDLEAPIRQHLEGLAPFDLADPAQHARLPWTWSSRSPRERAMLHRMGLGGGARPERLRRPGRYWLGLGAALGLAFGALAGLMGVTANPPELEHPAPPLTARLAKTGATTWQVQATAPQHVVRQAVEAGARVRVDMAQIQTKCVASLGKDAELWRCGSDTRPPRLPPEVTRSLVLLDASPGDGPAERLAATLLASGSADAVVLSALASLPAAAIEERLGTTVPGGQTLVLILGEKAGKGPPAGRNRQDPLPTFAPTAVLAASDPNALAQALRFPGQRSAAEAWPDARVISGDPSKVLLRGLPKEWTDPSTGITFVHVPGGTFQMGSPENEAGRDSDERQHQVTLSPFWIARTETTNAQYGDFGKDRAEPGGKPEETGPAPADEADLPVVYVTWYDADAFCKEHGYRLPTEAQWEYAARGGTETAYFWGDDPDPACAYANVYDQTRKDARSSGFGSALDCEDGFADIAPAGSFQPNPFGLQDMTGNVLEWVADWYGKYPQGPQTDPEGPRTGDYRALRGGAFSSGAVFLRSAFRFWYLPVCRNQYFGFRCVRAARRQP
jgi:sulfatase modifying factor 1